MPDTLTPAAAIPSPGDLVEAPRLKRILMPVEFSGRCERAALYAQVLARHFHSEVVLLHAVGPPNLPYGAEALLNTAVDDLRAQQAEESEARLKTFLDAELTGLSVKRIVQIGDPFQTIVDAAANEQCDLILMPTHGYGSLRRILVGSITAEVLRHAPCPVLSGPHLEDSPAPETIQFRKVLCALDLCPESEAVLSWAAGFSREFAAELRVVHAIPEATWKAGGLYFDPDWRVHVAKTARAEIAKIEERLHLTADVHIEIGEVAEAVSAAAQEWKPDLLVIGRGVKRGVLGRLRAKAYAILRQSACPVVAI